MNDPNINLWRPLLPEFSEVRKLDDDELRDLGGATEEITLSVMTGMESLASLVSLAAGVRGCGMSQHDMFAIAWMQKTLTNLLYELRQLSGYIDVVEKEAA